MTRLVRRGAAALALLGLSAPTPAPAVTPTSPSATATTGGYAAPVRGRLQVVRPFVAPASPYAPGHRGADLAVTPGQTVAAAGAGVVEFAGDVAGRGVVVLAHADGVRTEYEPVRASVVTGQQVSAGEPIGTVRGDHGRCPPGRCLHWGARRAGDYFDPLDLLRPLGPVRLLPWS